MRVLVPGIEFNAEGIADSPQQDDAGKLFDLIKITDSRVPELSAKAGQPTPFVILQVCFYWSFLVWDLTGLTWLLIPPIALFLPL